MKDAGHILRVNVAERRRRKSHPLNNYLIRKYIPYHICAAMVIGAKISFILSCRADRYGAPIKLKTYLRT